MYAQPSWAVSTLQSTPLQIEPFSVTSSSYSLSATTNLLGPEGVDDGRFANIGVAHKANTDVLFVSAHAGKLAQQAQQAALAKGVGDAGMEGQARVLTTQIPQPPLGHPGWHLHHACQVSLTYTPLHCVHRAGWHQVPHKAQRAKLLAPDWFAGLSLYQKQHETLCEHAELQR